MRPDNLRRLSLASGLPYLRQTVTVKGEVFTVMAYDFCNPPRVQLAPGIRHTALGWDIEQGTWTAWGKCQLNKEDAAWVKEYKAAQPKPVK